MGLYFLSADGIHANLLHVPRTLYKIPCILIGYPCILTGYPSILCNYPRIRIVASIVLSNNDPALYILHIVSNFRLLILQIDIVIVDIISFNMSLLPFQLILFYVCVILISRVIFS